MQRSKGLKVVYELYHYEKMCAICILKSRYRRTLQRTQFLYSEAFFAKITLVSWLFRYLNYYYSLDLKGEKAYYYIPLTMNCVIKGCF
jgi:hypothetical protein